MLLNTHHVAPPSIRSHKTYHLPRRRRRIKSLSSIPSWKGGRFYLRMQNQRVFLGNGWMKFAAS
ncbi:hypothetical protein MTR_6g005260 [Medicago truncatula]|uniref:Uncharacterized protein n=1 Tax=Medicago truncatula TaxID=3880 RepID=G7KQ11_MEDTR|nr:hypothetical protein MTR_6g005260 [Medicago truncatula]